jgi:MFS family permease
MVPALRGREFRLLFAGQAVSVVGDALFPIALAFAVLDDLDGSPAELGLVLAAQALPLALLVLAAGVWADRLPRRALMLVSDGGRAAVQGVLALLLLTGSAELWHLAVLVAAYGAFEALFRPAAGGMVPQLVAPEDLQNANALMSISQSTALAAGPALGGALVVLIGPGAAIAVDAGTFLVSAACLLALRPPPAQRAPVEATHFLADLRAGVGEVLARPWMKTMLPVLSAYHLISLPCTLALGPVLADQDLGGAGSWGLITMAFGIGCILGSAIALRVEAPRPMTAAAVCWLVASCQPLFIAIGDSTAVIAGLEAVAGLAVAYGFTVWESTLGRQIPEHALSRVVSLDYFSTVGVMPLGFALVGPLAGVAGVETTMIASTLLVSGLALAAALAPGTRSLRAVSAPAGT